MARSTFPSIVQPSSSAEDVAAGEGVVEETAAEATAAGAVGVAITLLVSLGVAAEAVLTSREVEAGVVAEIAELDATVLFPVRLASTPASCMR